MKKTVCHSLKANLLALLVVPLLLGSSCTVRRSLGLSTDTTISQEATVQAATVDLGLLQWRERLDAVRSEVEILDGIPASLDPDKPSLRTPSIATAMCMAVPSCCPWEN